MIANCRYACIVNRGEEQTVRIGIDLGGTKTEVIALSEQGQQLFRHRLPTPREDYRQTIETIASLGEMAEPRYRIARRRDGTTAGRADIYPLWQPGYGENRLGIADGIAQRRADAYGKRPDRYLRP